MLFIFLLFFFGLYFIFFYMTSYLMVLLFIEVLMFSIFLGLSVFGWGNFGFLGCFIYLMVVVCMGGFGISLLVFLSRLFGQGIWYFGYVY